MKPHPAGAITGPLFPGDQGDSGAPRTPLPENHYFKNTKYPSLKKMGICRQ